MWFFRSRPDQYTILKSIFGFPFGAAVGCAFYYGILSRLQFSKFVQMLFGATFMSLTAFGYAFSIHIRCTTLLVVPQVFGRAGRTFIMTVAVTLLIAGPITNILRNTQEVTRVVECSLTVAANQTKERLNLIFVPVEKIVKSIAGDAAHLIDKTSDLKKLFAPISFEVEDDSEVEKLKEETDAEDELAHEDKRSDVIEARSLDEEAASKGEKDEIKYERKLDYRCEDVFNYGAKHCREVFKNKENECMRKLWIAGYLLCLPLKLTVICELARHLPTMFGMDCDSTEAVNPGFGEGYESAHDASRQFQKEFDVKMQYKLEKVDEPLYIKDSKEAVKKIEYEFQRKKELVNFIMLMLKRILAFMFLIVVYEAHKYCSKFCKDFSFDNIYITSYFKKIDARRHKAGKRTLLPLKKKEKQTMVFPTSLKLLGPEKSKLIKGTVSLIMNVFTSSIIIVVDVFMVETLEIVKKHSYIEFHQEGSHWFKFEVMGKETLFTKLINRMLRHFNQKHSIDHFITNLKCLPHPDPVQYDYVWKIYLVYLSVWIVMAFEAYGLRLRRIVAGFFFRKREKKRILYLYNDMLKKRKGYSRYMRHKARRQARENVLERNAGTVSALVTRFPVQLGWVKNLGMFKEHCLICDENQSKDSHVCSTYECVGTYCKDCWKDLKYRCFVCSAEIFSSDSDLSKTSKSSKSSKTTTDTSGGRTTAEGTTSSSSSGKTTVVGTATVAGTTTAKGSTSSSFSSGSGIVAGTTSAVGGEPKAIVSTSSSSSSETATLGGTMTAAGTTAAEESTSSSSRPSEATRTITVAGTRTRVISPGTTSSSSIALSTLSSEEFDYEVYNKYEAPRHDW